MSLFRAEGLVKRFGGLLATDHVSLAVEAGEIHALIGPNGAGKSTLVNLISGLLPADAGRIVLDGVELTALTPHARTRAGLARCFQISSVFRNDSVRDNLLLAVQAQAGSSFRCLSRRDAEHALQERAEALAQRTGLAEVLERNAGTSQFAKVEERVRHGSYELVLFLAGYTSHKSVKVLKACKASGVPLVYLSRGYSLAQVEKAIADQRVR